MLIGPCRSILIHALAACRTIPGISAVGPVCTAAVAAVSPLLASPVIIAIVRALIPSVLTGAAFIASLTVIPCAFTLIVGISARSVCGFVSFWLIGIPASPFISHGCFACI